MDIQIKTIEDLSLNAWPSHQIQIYDGWLLRFSYFYTHRTNCVEQIGASSIPIEEKIAYCEKEYASWGTPAIFKISPLIDPSFDSLLSSKGYVVEHRIFNMLLDLHSLAFEDGTGDSHFYQTIDSSLYDFHKEIDSDGMSLSCSSLITQAWIDALFRLKNTTNIMHRMIVPSMYQAIPKETICVALEKDGIIYGTGLGILDRDHIGVYAIHVHPDFRRRGYARKIVCRILQEGYQRGASYGYLQVVSNNDIALRLYSSLGFKPLYRDWFRVKYTK